MPKRLLTLAELGVAVSGTNAMRFLLEGVEPFVGWPVDDAMLAALDKRVPKQVRPMRSTVPHSNYRRQVASVPAQRLVRELAGAV